VSDPTDRPTVAELEQMYRVMVVATLAGERARAEVTAGRMAAAFYPVRGLEGVCAALGAALRPTDALVSTYRNLGDALAKGASLRAIIAELYGRVDGTSKGKGGPMHLHDQEAGFVTSTGIVGSGLPIAVGLATAAQLDGRGQVVATTFGDGATSIGAWHESLNLAAVWRLPIVFVCQNNQWGEHTSIADYAANPELAQRAGAYRIRATKVDGFDPIATWRELRDAVAYARAGHGPAFVECLTYRLSGHSGTADFSYVPQDRLDEALRRDPAPTFRAWLRDSGIADESRIAELDAEAAATVEDAFAFGLASPEPTDVLADVFAPS
jgi:pyruvate dehydrogenase E1 component alpha subunit